MAIGVSISPPTFTLTNGGGNTQTFAATVTGDPSNGGVTWSVLSEAIPQLQAPGPLPPLTPSPFPPISSLQELVGTIDQSGNYTGPSSLARTTPVHNLVVAVSKTDPRVFATADLFLLNENFKVWTDAQKRGEQWFVCARCGNPYPMSQLTQQKGILICTRYCWDNLTIERRPRFTQMVLTTSATPLPEMSDRRAIDMGWFVIDVEVG